jgi:short-subunit dehydrogenase
VAAKPVALVTGASAGIGAAFARALAKRGYDLILVARRRDRLEALALELKQSGAAAEVLPADLTDPAQVRLVEQRIAAVEALDLLVNNAGFGVVGRFWQTDPDAQERMHLLHIVATMRLTHAALAAMTARDRGAVINVSSVAGFVESPGSVTYGATKRWMNAFTEGLDLDLRSRNSAVRVQALCPGFTYSEFHDVAGIDRKTISASLWTTAEDVVAASLAGLDRGKLFVIPGRRYSLLVRLLKLTPAVLLRIGTAWYAASRSRSASSGAWPVRAPHRRDTPDR